MTKLGFEFCIRALDEVRALVVLAGDRLPSSELKVNGSVATTQNICKHPCRRCCYGMTASSGITCEERTCCSHAAEQSWLNTWEQKGGCSLNYCNNFFTQCSSETLIAVYCNSTQHWLPPSLLQTHSSLFLLPTRTFSFLLHVSLTLLSLILLSLSLTFLLSLSLSVELKLYPPCSPVQTMRPKLACQ